MVINKFSRNLKLFYLISSLLMSNSVSVKGSDLESFSPSNEITEIDFENIFFKYTKSYENYDSYSNQFDNFFGMNFLETETKRNFQDLSISVDSKNIRDLYENMLHDLTSLEKVKINEEPIYKKKI